MDKDIICDYENLYKAYKQAKCGKKFNGSSAKFQTMTLEGLHLLKEQLENQTYRMNPYNEFKVYDLRRELLNRVLLRIKLFNIVCATTYCIRDWKASLSKPIMQGRKEKGLISEWIV